jgi:hypothetical protein
MGTNEGRSTDIPNVLLKLTVERLEPKIRKLFTPDSKKNRRKKAQTRLQKIREKKKFTPPRFFHLKFDN